MIKYNAFTPDQVAKIIDDYNGGKTIAKIAADFSMEPEYVRAAIRKARKENPSAFTRIKSRARRKEKPMPTPREMIKALYDMGYRIENNQIVCYKRQVVVVDDIIKED